MSALASVSDYESEASQLLGKRPWGYYRSGAGDEYSLEWNRIAFKK